MSYIHRALEPKILESAEHYRVITITGPRQSGKTTLCRHLFPDYSFVNLERPGVRMAAAADPDGFLRQLGKCAIIDEVQNVPELLSSIQASVDKDKSLRYVISGSCNFSLLKSASQSLAGRTSIFALLPLSLSEVSESYRKNPTNLLEFNGFYPGVIADGIAPDIFFDNYYQTYIERDVRDQLNIKNLDKYDRFLRLMAGRAGSEFNASSIAAEAGVSSPTIADWLSTLMASYIVYKLPPYFTNLPKRLTKSPKIYFYDTGLMCYLLGIQTPEQLDTHPLRGAVFENMVLSELLKAQVNKGLSPRNIYYYRENAGREIDFVEEKPSGLSLYEVKAAATFRPEFLKNMKYLNELMPGKIVSSTLLYDGPTLSPEIRNFREESAPQN